MRWIRRKTETTSITDELITLRRNPLLNGHYCLVLIVIMKSKISIVESSKHNKAVMIQKRRLDEAKKRRLRDSWWGVESMAGPPNLVVSANAGKLILSECCPTLYS